MGLDLWFQADVARILGATYEAMWATAGGVSDGRPSRERAEGYRQGFGAALRVLAVAFGVPDPAAARAGPWRVAQRPELEPAGERMWTGTELDGEVVVEPRIP
jgi:hypothetical protein